MAEEVWKVVPGYEEYEASNTGKLRNSKTKKNYKWNKGVFWIY